MLAESNFYTWAIMASERFFYKGGGLRKQGTSEPRRNGETKKGKGNMGTLTFATTNIYYVCPYESCWITPTFSRLKCFSPFTAVTFRVFTVNSDPKGDTYARDSTSPDSAERKEETWPGFYKDLASLHTLRYSYPEYYGLWLYMMT